MTTKPDTKSSRKPRAHQAYDLRRKALHLAVASCFSVAPVFAATAVPPSALPANIGSYTYGTAKAGMVTGDVTVGSTRTISNNNNAILNWGAGLNINTGETLRFQQVNDASKVLNRVSGGNATKILGTLSSNGKVYLINNAGVVVGAGAHIDTNGFVASTLNLSDDDFTKGINRFTASTTDATGGVNNAGTITTPNGGFVYLIGAQVENSGVITTPSGEAILAAGSSVELVDSADPSMRVKVSAKALPVNLSQAMTKSNGNIFSVLNSGKIAANSAVVGQNGKIQLRSAGAVTTTVSSVLEAKGDTNTDGGLVRGFADTTGHYSGVINVAGRNGGKAETSAHYLFLDPGLSVAANALVAGGHSGQWLLDPIDFTINQSAANTIQGSLNGGTSVTISTAAYGSDTGRITMTNANIAVNYAGTVSLTLDADEKVIISGSSITSTGGGAFGFDASANSGITVTNSTIQTNHGGHLGLYTTNGNVGITNSHLTSLSPPSSGTSINIGTGNGSVTIDNSNVQFVTSSPYAGNIGINTSNGNVNIINQSKVGATNSNGGGLQVNIAAYGGNINIASSGIGVQSGALGSSSTVNLLASSGNITMIGADATHSIRAHEVDLIAELGMAGTGNIGQSGHFIVTEADRLMIGNGLTQNAFVTDLGVLNSANISVANDAELQLQKGAALTSYGSFISIDAKTASIASAGDIVLDNGGFIEFSGTGGQNNDAVFSIATTGTISLDHNSEIEADSYGGSASLNLFANTLSLDHGSHITADFIGLNYDIGGPDIDASKRLALAAFAKNSRVTIGADSGLSAGNGIGMVTGRLDINGGSIVSHNDLDLLVAGDINISGNDSGGYVGTINADTEAFITTGGHLNIKSSPNGVAAGIYVGSQNTLFMNFVGNGITQDGWSVDGVANAFDSPLTQQQGKTGIFVDGTPGVIGTNTFITYGKPTSALAGVTNAKNNDLLTNPLGNSTVANNQDAADKFFGKDDDSKDEGDDKGSGKKGKDKPKECS